MEIYLYKICHGRINNAIMMKTGSLALYFSQIIKILIILGSHYLHLKLPKTS